MKRRLFFIDWIFYGRNDVIDAFRELGHHVVLYPVELESKEDTSEYNMDYIVTLMKEIEKQNISFVFSMNYFTSVSEACLGKGIPYVSWIYDNPYSRAFGISITNNCNYIFTFNRHTYNQMIQKGVKTIYYAPLAANVGRLDKIRLSRLEWEKYGSELSFVGSLYSEKEKGNFYKKLSGQLKKSGKQRELGFLDGVIEAQSNIYGTNIMESCLTDAMVESIQKVLPFQMSMFTAFTTASYMYAAYVLAVRVTELERRRILEMLSERHQVKLYTPEETAPGKCILCGKIDHRHIGPKVFKASKINLNITLKSIETGIPLRAMDIMGAGGFLISNYQEDYLLYFEPEKDFVFYENIEDLLEKTAFYLHHDTEREKIAGNGHDKMAKEHTYSKRIAGMLSIPFPQH